MKVLVDGTFYEYDTAHLTVREAFEMKERTGFGIVAFEDAWDAMEPVALAWVAYLAKKRAGEQVNWDTFDFDLGAMLTDLYAADSGDALDPTSATLPTSEPPPADTQLESPAATTSEPSGTTT